MSPVVNWCFWTAVFVSPFLFVDTHFWICVLEFLSSCVRCRHLFESYRGRWIKQVTCVCGHVVRLVLSPSITVCELDWSQWQEAEICTSLCLARNGRDVQSTHLEDLRKRLKFELDLTLMVISDSNYEVCEPPREVRGRGGWINYPGYPL